jgi:predicted permease
MRLWSRFRCWLRAATRRPQLETDMEAELRFHMEAYAADLMRSGISPGEAVRRARIEFGGAERVKEECREARGVHWLETLRQDVRYASQTLRKSPGFSVVAMATIALGVGANVAIFSILEGVLLRPLPYPHAEQLLSLDVTPLALDRSARGIAPEDYFVFRERGQAFQSLGIYAETDTDRDVNVTTGSEPERVHAVHVTQSVLSVLEVAPMLGRTFSNVDASPGAPLTAILTYSYWRRRFGGDAAVIGKTIIVDGTVRQIIGIVPRDFRFLDMHDLALILPLQLDRNKILLGNFSYFGIARLKAGYTIEQASSDVARLLPAVLNSFPAPPGVSLNSFKNARIAPSILPLKEEIIGNIATLLWVVMGGVGMVLLIACANVANLLLVRTEARQHELALRVALGAGRWRIAVLLACESAVLGLLGSAAGLALAWAGLRLVRRLAPLSLPRIADIRLDVPVFLFAIAAALLATVLFALIPILKYFNVRASLSQKTRGASQSRERLRARNALVAAQVALALLLLTCCGLMIRTFRAITQVDPGFARPSELQTFRISIPVSDVPDDTRIPHLEQRIEEKLAAIHGVRSVAFSSAVPLDSDNTLDNVYAADHTYGPSDIPPLRHLLHVSPDYLRTLGIPLMAGRDISWTDTYNRVPVALISENFAREYWRTPDGALGKRIRISSNDDWRQIIGVVGDVHDYGLDKPARTNVYWPAVTANLQSTALHVTRRVTFIVRSPEAGSEALLKQIRQAVWSVDANLPLASVQTLEYLHASSMARTSFTLVALGVAAGMALLLGTVGLYGAVAYSVSQRTREIGIRMALGSQPGEVLKLVLGQGMWFVLAGIGIGLTASFASTRFLSSLLFGVSPMDPLTLAAVMTLLALVSATASYIPARRAVRIDPFVALRCE